MQRAFREGNRTPGEIEMTIQFGNRRARRRIGTVGPWVEELKRQVERTPVGDVVFDISGAETINSEEISAVTVIHLDLTRNDRRLLLVNALPQIVEVFDLTRVNRLVHVSGPRLEKTGFASALNVAHIAR